MADSPIQEIVCCIGQPVAGNPTQFLMERAFAAAGLDWRCLTLEVPAEALEGVVLGMRAMGFRGGDIAFPHKGAVAPLLDELSQSAKLIGEVTYVHRRDNLLVGDNTNGKGCLATLREIVDPAGKHVVIIGAGSVARAIAIELALAKTECVTIVNRTAERGSKLVELLQQNIQATAEFVHLSGDYALPETAGIVINATSIGQGDPDARVPVRSDSLRPKIVAADVIFNPPRTRFIREAEDRGCRTLDGLSMLIHQSVIEFQTWTGVEPDQAVMREALEEYLEI